MHRTLLVGQVYELLSNVRQEAGDARLTARTQVLHWLPCPLLYILYFCVAAPHAGLPA